MAITVIEAGRKGGFTAFERRGRQFFVEIGKRGQKAMREKYPSMASEWGKRGGRPKKLPLSQIVGEKGK